ncbi:hypothetical protein CRE_09815 [Caenorhabditis remanei]|uniref:F-box domain-containing protein n=1 Tax=Caenorhabditis remanei TaxID=31234 RepID=E3NDG7_CAERE|nr:hypothetical protein CRE_09815 [Caenorhabditis remanei]
MDRPKPFPILRLPFLAIEEVFKAMHPLEIINFCLIAERNKQITNMMTFCSKYSVALDINKILKIAIRGTNNIVSGIYEMTSEKNLDGVIGYVVGGFKLTVFKYSKDPIEGWKQLSKHVLDIFNKHTIDTLTVDMDEFVNYNVSIIDFLKTNEISVNKCSLFHWYSNINIDKHAAYLLENIKINNEFNFYLHIKNVNLDLKIPKGLTKLKMINTNWIEYKQLLEIDSVTVDKWISMETNLNLELLDFVFESMKEFKDGVLFDIPYEVVDNGVKRDIKTRSGISRE